MASIPILSPREGERIVFFADRSMLDLDLLPLDEGLRAVLPAGGEWAVTIVDGQGREYPMTVNGEEGYLIGNGVREFLKRHPGNIFVVEAIDRDKNQYCISAWSPAEAVVADPLADLFIGFDEENVLVLDRLTSGLFDPPELHDLNRKAQGMSAHLGFETLLSPDAAQDIVLYPHQLNAVSAVVRRFRGRALLCDEVGMGKTIEAGMVLLEYLLRGMVRKVLILTPPSLTQQWKEEMQRKFSLDFVLSDSDVFRAAGEEGGRRFDRVIASMHTAKRQPHAGRIRDIYYDMVIVDEAHHLRNRGSVSFKFVDALQKRYILLLTATPVQNDLSELFNLITLLKPGHLSTSYAFTRDFVKRGDRMTPRNLPRLRNLLSDVMIRNQRATVDLRLPRRIARTILVDLTPEERDLYRAITDYVRSGYNRQDGKKRNSPLVLWTLQQEVGSSTAATLSTLSRIARGSNGDDRDIEQLATLARAVKRQAKVAAALDVVSSYGDKLIVFTRFRETQELLHRALQVAGVETALFHGQLGRAEKEDEIKRFADTAQVLVSTESGGEGRNLQFCHAILNYDLPWNPMRIEQRIGRVHRVGQTRDVHIFNLSARDTVDAYILDILDAKINMFELVVGEVDMILGNLDDERDFEEIVLDILRTSLSESDLRDRMGALGDRVVDAKREYTRVRDYEKNLFRTLETSDVTP